MGSFDLFYWDSSYNSILVVDLAICIAIFTSLRLFSGAISHINAWDELVNKDNPAFGISLAGVAFAVTLVLIGAIYGKPTNNLQDSATAVALYGGVGIVLMAVTRLIFDKIALPKISIRDEIARKNVAAGIIDAGNVIATAIIIQSVTMWIEVNTLEGLTSLFTGYAVSQVLLTLATFVRVRLFSWHNKGLSIQEALQNGNNALALAFAGRRIGTAFAITAAANIMVYEIYEVEQMLLAWAGISLIMMGVLAILTFIADKVILFKINIDDEIVQQRNVAVGALQCIIYISLGMLLAQLIIYS